MYHIVKTKSKVKPFSVVLLSDNGEVLSQHSLATKQAAFKNVKSQLYEVTGMDFVQDDTKDKPVVYHIVGSNRLVSKSSAKPDPVYIPGKNTKKNKK